MKQLSDSVIGLNLTISSNNQIIIAYEPIWSIGTNIIPTSEEIIEVFDIIKDFMQESQIASNLKLVYGGSVNLDNIHRIFAIDFVQGVLIGKSSLDANLLLKILDINFTLDE